MTRAAQMVLTCKRSSDATPGGNANWKSWAATGAFAANAANDSASAGLAVCGALAGAGAGAVAVTFGGSTQHGGGLVPWAQTMATETASEAANASQRPRPLANTSLPTNSTVVACATRVAIFVIFGCPLRGEADGDRYDAVERRKRFFG
jgi:hypothetical protein